MPRRRKLHILRFAFRGKSSVVPLLLLSPPNPLTLGFGGAPVGGLLNPLELIVTGNGRALCEPFRNGACDAIASAAVPRSKYPWGALSLIPLPLRAALPKMTGTLIEPPNFRL